MPTPCISRSNRSTVAQAAYPEALFFDGDSDRILQVVTNLLSNAIKFSPVASTVRVYTEATSDSILLKVVDEGRGIPVRQARQHLRSLPAGRALRCTPEGRHRALVSPSAAASSSSTAAPSGRSATSAPALRSTSCSPAPARASDVVLPSSLPARGEGSILVCDDDAGIRTVVSEHLTRQGYTVIEAQSGEQALILAAEHQVEAILLDLYMPGLSGWETLQRLRNNPNDRQHSGSRFQRALLHPSSLSSPATPRAGCRNPSTKIFSSQNSAACFTTATALLTSCWWKTTKTSPAVLTASFQDAAVHIDHAATRQQAIRQCITRPPDLLILDLTLPDGDGFSLVEWLRQQPTLRTLPLVVYSGREISETEMAKLRLGPTEFLTKAKVQPQEVEELVLSMVQRIKTRFADLAAAAPTA